MGALLGGAHDRRAQCHRRRPSWPRDICRCASGGSSTAPRRRCSTTTICRSRSARQKMFADFAPSPIDRLMGRILVDRTMEMLISVYHPVLRRFVGLVGPRADAGRAGRAGRHLRRPAHRLQGGRRELSRQAGVRGRRMACRSGAPTFRRAAWRSRACSRRGRRAGWPVSIDDKPMPFEETSAETTRGYLQAAAVASHLSRRAGMGSPAPTSAAGRSTCWANGCARPRASTRLEDLGTLTARYVVQRAGSGDDERRRDRRMPVSRSPTRAATAPSSSPSRTPTASRFLAALGEAGRLQPRHRDRPVELRGSPRPGRSLPTTRRSRLSRIAWRRASAS